MNIKPELKMTRPLKIIYIGALLPLLIGSLTFFYWFYKRKWFASNVNIELLAYFTILGFLLVGVITLVLCIDFTLKNRKDWKKIIVPIIIVGLTFPIIDLF